MQNCSVKKGVHIDQTFDAFSLWFPFEQLLLFTTLVTLTKIQGYCSKIKLKFAFHLEVFIQLSPLKLCVFTDSE